MNEVVRQARNKLLAAWQYRWIGVSAAWVLAVVSVILVSFMNDTYQATARIHVDTQTVLKPLMKELAAQPDIDQQVRMLARTLISRPTIEKLIGLKELGFEVTTPEEREQLIAGLVRSINVQGSGPNVYTLSYRDNDAKRARGLIEGLVTLFVESSTGGKKQDSAQAMSFINQQITQYEEKLSTAENRLKDFKVKHFGVSGATQQDFFARMASLSDEVNKLKLDLSAAQRSRDSLRVALSSESPQLPAEALPVRERAGPTETEIRLDTQRRALDDLLRRFTEAHPDVAAARKAIADMERIKRDEDELNRRRTPAVGTAPPNPVYQQLRVQLANAEAQTASLQSQLAMQQGRLDVVRSQAGRVPQIEAELAQINRDYEVVRIAHQRLVERRESAAMGAKLDESSQLADFRIIEPALVSPNPVFPSRVVMALGSLLASLAAGIGAALGMAIAFPLVADEQELAQLTKRPVLGGVSLSLDGPAKLAARWQLVQFSATVVIFLVSATLWVLWIYFSSKAI